jgi:hypothetical protein
MNKLAHQVERANKKARQRRILWLDENKGVLTRIATACSVSQPFVSEIFHGRRSSRNGQVEALLADAGAPGFEPNNKVA